MPTQGDMGRVTLKTTSVLVVDGDRARRQRLVAELGRRVALAEGAGSIRRADSLLKRCRFDCVIADLEAGDGSSLEWVSQLKKDIGSAAIILSCEPHAAKQAIGALRFGVSEILMRPFEPASLVAAIQRAGASGRNGFGVIAVPRGVRAGTDTDAILVGKSESMAEVRRLIERVAPLPATVLIEGETGTGKELVARLLHDQSGRRGAFVPVNCGAIAAELLESELFGHVKGAFTSAHQVREGLFVAARGGTLFLDEISEMPLELEVKLLRALEEGAIRPVGSDREVRTDVRIVASTQHDLAERARRGRFREDLYYRLNVIHVQLPPLRERTEDIEDLAHFFMDSIAGGLGLAPMALGRARIEMLQDYDWPGNARELRNFVERILMLGKFPAESLAASVNTPTGRSFGYPEDWTLERVKEHHMRRVLEVCEGNRSQAARRLGVSRKTLERKLGPRGGSADMPSSDI